MINRRNFVKSSAITGIGIVTSASLFTKFKSIKGLRVGIIGLDTSHSIEYTKILNAPASGEGFNGYKVVAAYPQGSLNIKTSVERIGDFTGQMKTMGIEIVGSIDSLLEKVDVVLLETNDGRRHLEQAIPVLKAGKRMFIDKPMAASLSDAMIIFDEAQKYHIPIFSSSSLRFIKGMDEIKYGAIGNVIGAEAFSPAPIEKTHPDLFWYGIHGVEILFTAMGIGCKTVIRIATPDTDVLVGTWNDGRIGTFRGSRSGVYEFGAQIFGEAENRTLGTNIDKKKSHNYGFIELIRSVGEYFKTGFVPVKPEETLEILAFMEAADESKKRGGIPVSIEEIIERAKTESIKYQL
ncbi:MAG TPA: Gfo/Idh/MocA family oxidoreductase [Prolixibacteraceae bacterium]|nr:Gfo/Idh/MocA family oxidoreductase [Prolixibacteraceae bacterium]